MGDLHSLKLMPLTLAGATLGSGIISGISSLFGGYSQKKATQDTNKTNLQIARETNEAQLQAMRENNEWSRQQAIDMFNMENEYNDPAAQANRLLNAGISPANVLGGSGASAASGNGDISTPSAAGSMPNFIAPNMVTPPSMILSATDAISKLSSAALNFASAEGRSKENKWIDENMKAQIDDLLADIRYKSVESSYKEFMLAVDKVFMPFERSSNLMELGQKIKNLGMEYTLLMSKNKVEEANEKLLDAERKLKHAQEDQVRQSTPIIIDNLKKTGKQIDSVTNANNASAAYSRQLVNESVSRETLNKQQYDYIEDTKTWSKALLQATAENQQYNLIENKSTILARIEQIKKLPGLTEASIKELEQRAEALEKNNTVFNQRFALEVIGDITSAFLGYTQGMENATGATKNIVVPFR